MIPDLVAGTIAGFAICGVGHPFDTLKVLNQTAPAKFPTMGSAFRSVIKNNGPAGLYKGVGSPMVGNGILNAVQFTIFSRLKNRFTNDGKDMTIGRISAAASLTGLVVAMVEGPQDLFKTQTQAQMLDAGNKNAAPPRYKGTFDCARVILKERGMMGATQGLQATMFRNFVGVGAYYAIYEATRMELAGKDRPVSSLSPFEVLLAGGCGGVAYWTLSYPLDIIKSAIQADSINPSERRYKGFLQTATTLWKEGGMKRYTAGLTPCLARSFPANAAGFAAYEMVKASLEKPAKE